MNKFLLLRSNKQSGPYSAEELQQMGLKPYDLIWVDGKSAAWRYPGEVEDLKSFAPAVEEQPYDRFYKKPEAETSSVPVEKPAATQPVTPQPQPAMVQATPQQQPVEIPAVQQQPSIPQQASEKPARKEKEYKRVFVTLPSGVALQQPVAKPAAETPVHIQYQPPVQPPPAETKMPEAKPEIKADIHYPKKRSRFKGVPLAAMIIGMVVMTALGIVIGMSLDRNKGVPLIKKVDPAPPANNQQGSVPNEPQRDQSSETFNQTAAQMMQDSIQSAQANKPAVKTTLLTKKNNSSTDTNQQSVAANLPVNEEPKLNKEEAPAKKELPKPTAAPELEKQVFVSNNDFEVGPFGGISKLALTVKNTSEHTLSLVVVQLEYLKANKEVFKTEDIYFRDVAPNATLTVDAPRSGRGSKINYKVTLINSRDQIYHAGN